MAHHARQRGRRPVSAPPPPPPPPRKSWLRRLVSALLFWGALFGLLIAAGIAVLVFDTARSLPDFNDLKASQVGQTILVRAHDGTELVSIGPSYGRWISYRDIPPVMTGAILAVEDQRYYSHFGLDPIGIARSAMVRVESGSWRQGASTITQQLARNLFLNNDRTWTRKVREAVYALALEYEFSKEQILELYLNKVYFGGGAYGIDAASREFFGHSGDQISIPEAAVIAGLVKAPSRYSPTADEVAAINRAKVTLRLMEENGVISAADAASVNLEKLRFQRKQGQNSVRYFTDWILQQLDQTIGRTDEPLEIWTTLDPVMQRAATTAVQANTPAGAQGALVSLDRDGAVLAMVGGVDYVRSNYNRATQAMRQPGSSWKLFVYLAALEAGYKPDDFVVDEPVSINGWRPVNANGKYAGSVSLRTAFAHSINTVAVRIGESIGFGTIAGMARRFGITTPVDTNPSMALGTANTRLIDMTRAYAAVSGRGASVTPYGIVKVRTTHGKLLYQHVPEVQQVLISPFVAAGITDLLQAAVTDGTGQLTQIGRPVAGKTGTTSQNKDGWFLGFSSGITTGVWMGRDDAKPVAGLFGGRNPARAFASFMRVAVADRPIEPFETEFELPNWQVEPDAESWGANPDDYYLPDAYSDTDENNTPPPRDTRPGDNAPYQDASSPIQTRTTTQGPPSRTGPKQRSGAQQRPAPPAAERGFLDRAIGANPRGVPPQQQ